MTTDNILNIAAADLTTLVESVLVKVGVPAANAALVAEAIVWTNLRAVDSHGVQLLPHYAGQIERGEIDVHTKGSVLDVSGVCLRYDAESGLGQVTSRECCAHAVRLAAEYGIGMVVARNASHFGSAGFWSHTISKHGYIGLTMCDASMQVPPWQGRERRFGTNPISVAVPHTSGEGWLLDMATTTVSLGKLEQIWLKGEPNVPYGWAVDRDGVPTTETASLLDGGMLMPLGGYKGSGLAMMVEILTGVLAGGPFFGGKVTGLRHKGRPMHANHTFIAIDVQRFLPLDEFQSRMELLVSEVKSAAPAKGYDEILVAGDPEWRAMEQRRLHGVPIHEAIWKTVVDVADRLGVNVPVR
jgi:LDH2 family malate/lactate/ureidoglycolate dehydrogenase